MITVKKRDGRKVQFNEEKIFKAILGAAKETEEFDEKRAHEITDKVIKQINDRLENGHGTVSVEEIQDLVENALMHANHFKTAKAYIIYRFQHQSIRDVKQLFSNIDLIESYIDMKDWRVNENANMTYSLQGLNFHVSSILIKEYWLKKIYPIKIRDAHVSGDFHLHDLGSLSTYCVGWDLMDLLTIGFRGVSGKIECRPPKHFRTALGQLVNFFYTMQGESAGAQAVSNFDSLLAPFVHYDKLTYKEVKQAMQEFLYNMNVPTRVGFQCMSKDTEILSKEGWVSYNQVKKGDKIATLNIENKSIEYCEVNNVFAKKYKGVMYNLKNRITDQLISPEHRIIRKKFNTNSYVLEKIEDAIQLKSPIIVPVGSLGLHNHKKENEDIIRLIAWVISEGTIDKGVRGSGRISIYQSKERNKENYNEIISLCKKLNLHYSQRLQNGLGKPCNVIRFDAESTRKILRYFRSDKNKGVKQIPDFILHLNADMSRLFIETYLKGDGHDNCKITTTSEEIKEGLLQVIVNAGYGATILIRKPDNKLSRKNRYIIRIIKHTDTYISKVKKIDYDGIIWCPNTKNETVVARRNGKIFITGNTPFTNITMDLEIPKFLEDEPVIIGGKPMDRKYGEFKEELMLINKAFAECMSEGDATGRVFTFPIPTYSITKDFDWENKDYKLIWEMSAKYGIPYFSNFINSDMKPDDVRSMCCRLRLDKRELKSRGGGLFGANPLTGSVGVVTLNLPRLGMLSKDEKDFFERMDNLLELAKQSLEIKRKALEAFTNRGLYPYSRYYLRNVHQRFNEYWKNHFSTIGIVGMNEACLHMVKNSIGSPKGKEFAEKVLDYIRQKILDYQKETGNYYNLEATPAEGTSYRLARLDREHFKATAIFANDDRVKEGAEPYYTNSTALPVYYTDDLFEALELQDSLQTKYTGGTVFHIFVGESNPSSESVKNLVKKVCSNYKLPYITLSPIFSVCPDHGYLKGNHEYCPTCETDGKKTECEVYSRIVGYLRPIKQWNLGKKEEFKQRRMFDKALV